MGTSSQGSVRKKHARTGKKAAVRIIGGEMRRRLLHFPEIDGLRPTPNRIRESLFNWLRDKVEGRTCLDLFAGSGALGFEALSRGAARVILVERNAAACRALAENAKILKAENAEVHHTSAWDWLRQTRQPPASIELVFLDPPFAGGLLPQACETLERSGLLAQSALIYLEAETEVRPQQLPDNWTVEKSGSASDVHYFLARRE
ncbi:MAG: 16S rRNA (guanine(966)-N(2))-methyltransferase RsmD [Gammaproteobacteria bacterium]|nr:16S rRNA (guanine(966)-N(2))-methyltransferase RsmD [Gammaproteobacteria bacterium]MXY88990.1 16S rRNA (guanine(966)-N(2))-methyltransferase RsmD [Gammaproteobacteria bacterium]MYA65864.1 16S rRNA (guanine(966)-N(2))-methyltransferase RsmD [Gammaproteobacteria bacterium]MYG95335.1 16S rRNA (guanine(966)-N(2))-methyltransferase RsmD [Gammaproteobacteria bacterium]MYH46694.1 16S rRNA (guanine(966)-N(2))-methyltransferase RsmD [Gammaproteobacteria bacterium]